MSENSPVERLGGGHWPRRAGLWLGLVLGIGALIGVTVVLLATGQEARLRIAVSAAKARYDAGNVLFVDVRAPEEYALGHLPAAISLPLGSFETRYRELRPEAEIIIYCN